MASPNVDIPYGPERKPWKSTVSSLALTAGGEYLIMPPSHNPIEQYPQTMEPASQSDKLEGLYQVPSEGLQPGDIDDANDKALERNKKFQKLFLGFQANQSFKYCDLNKFMNIHTNNIGDPFEESTCKTNTRWIERNVLDYYASLWNIRWPHNIEDKESYWGYCLTMGSTEGNMYSMWNARDYITGKAIMIDEKRGSSDYCVVQCKLENVDTCCCADTSYCTDTCPCPQTSKCKTILRPVAFYSADTH